MSKVNEFTGKQVTIFLMLANAFTYEDDGEPMIRANLCRCGASKDKPYCDGSHVGTGFTS